MTSPSCLHAVIHWVFAAGLAASLGTALAVGQTQQPPVAGQTATKPADAADPQAKPTPAAPAREQTPEQKAYADANKITDVDKKIEALRKFQTDYPKSAMVSAADSQILSALVKSVSDTTAKVREQAKKVAESPSQVSSRGGGPSGVASTLLAANLLLDEAEAYAQKGVAALADEAAYVAQAKKNFAERQTEAAKRTSTGRPLTPPADATYASTFKSARQSALLTLAQVFEKRGKRADAETTFKEAYLLQPAGATAATAALKLAEFAKAANRDQEQLEYLTVVALAGRLTKDSRADFQAVYRKTHGGSLDSLEDMLDARYEKTNAPLPITPYVQPKTRTNRLVLGEMFTGAGCPPCVAADMAFEGALDRYRPQDVALLLYHVHVPRPDPMTNPSTQARFQFYGVTGVPTFLIDGGNRKVGGGAADAAAWLYAEAVEPVIDRQLSTKPGAKVTLRATMTGSAVQVSVKVGRPSVVSKQMKVQIALVEEQVRYTGENGVRFHPMVVRSLARQDKDTQGFVMKPGQPLNVRYTFDLDNVVAEAKAHLDDFEVNNTRFGKFEFLEKKHTIDRSTLSVVVFVQDEATKQVLQAASVKLRPSAGAGSGQ